MNQLVLSAQLVSLAALRHTPAGLPVLDVELKHESELIQHGLPRKVSLSLNARAFGDLIADIQKMDIGACHGFEGFLGSFRNGRGVLFHINRVLPKAALK
jgi:primosomal replication protein N